MTIGQQITDARTLGGTYTLVTVTTIHGKEPARMAQDEHVEVRLTATGDTVVADVGANVPIATKLPRVVYTHLQVYQAS